MSVKLPGFLGLPRDLPKEPLIKSMWKSVVGSKSASDEIAFTMLTQEANNWCWSAVAQAARFHFVQAWEKSQTQIATEHIRRARPHVTCAPDQGAVEGGTCNPGHCDKPCNGMHKVRVVLQEVGIDVGTLSEEAPVPFESIQSEIRNGAPVICRIDFGDGIGHFICVSGWRVQSGTRQVYVHDPKIGEHGRECWSDWIPYANLANSYVVQGMIGSNNYSYRVRG